jgi:tetratricopeptide (TPR) repeat protein
VTQNLRDQLQATLSGTHTLERELGGGGMSKVFVAEETRLGRKVVIKVLSPELAQGISIERFEREIKTAAALQQANIVPVLSAGDTNGLPFYSMPFVTGESLRARLGKGPLPINEVVSVLRDVARALAYAHRQGVVHRDIKPDNVLLSEGAAVVTDFGIAKAISAARTGGAGATLTQVGTSIGTPAYMAPEQAAGDPQIDHRADIYSLGAMAYELLTGQAVFANRTPQRMLAAHMGETPKSVLELRPDTPLQLADLVMKCLAKEASDRPQDSTQVLLGLETTGGGSMQAMPSILLGGPGMFKKALGIYALAFVAVAILAKAAIVGIGLPDWVFPGSLVVMALGLPVVLWTGYVQRVARRAATATPTFTPGGTPTTQHGTIATMALKAAPHVSWYKTARGGMYAFGAFIVLIAAFMGMRQFGIGPFGSLIGSGALNAQDRIIMTDFATTGADSALGRVVSDAVRTGLAQSRVLSIASIAEVASALRRMERSDNDRVTLAVAQQIAARDGMKAIVDGEITPAGSAYIVVVKLVTADSGRELASYRATASGPDQLIEVADKAARALRSKAGESLRRVQNTEPLSDVTTSSLAALRKYTDGNRANDLSQWAQAERLLRETVQIDSGFAEAWRKLAVAMSNGGRPRRSIDTVTTRAFNLRHRASEHERGLIEAEWYRNGPGNDAAKAMEVYNAMMARGDSVASAYNGAIQSTRLRQYARAESLFTAARRISPTSTLAARNEVQALYWTGRLRETDSVIVKNLKQFPGDPVLARVRLQVLGNEGRFDELDRSLDSARKAPNALEPAWAFRESATNANRRGRLREEIRYVEAARARDSAGAGGAVQRAARDLARLDGLGLPTDEAVQALATVVARSKTGVKDLGVAESFGWAGRADLAKPIIARYRAETKDTLTLSRELSNVQRAEASVAVAEKRWTEATSLIRQADRGPGGAPINPCNFCLPIDLMWVFARAGMTDSIIASYEAYKKTPWGSNFKANLDVLVPAPLYEALAKAYDTKGDREKAAEAYRVFIELWKTADPELQPRVAAARKRLAELSPAEGSKR